MGFHMGCRRTVAPSDCDHLGHMNVSRYFAFCSDSVFSFQATIGLGRAAVADGRGLSFAVVHAESDFMAELLAGDVVEVRTGVIAVGTKSATFLHRVTRVEDGKLAFESTFRGVMLDLRTRRAVPVPDDIRTALVRFMVEQDT